MDVILSGLSFDICLAYLDDIIVYSASIEEHIERLDTILSRISEVGLKLKPSKCQLMQRHVSFLGHIVSADGIGTDPQKIEKVRDWPPPSDLKELRSFVGFCSYYRRFIDGFAELASPLTNLTKKSVRFSWSEDCGIAFEELKVRLVSAPVLGMPNDNDKFVLDTDASDVAIGAVLSQIQDGKERVIAYASRRLSVRERN
jgi:hypothetical protein